MEDSLLLTRSLAFTLVETTGRSPFLGMMELATSMET